MLMFAFAAAVAIAASPPPRKHRARKTSRSAASARTTTATLALALRRELLHDFLVQAGTQRPAFVDAHIADAGFGLRIGPTSVDVDFIGSPIVRAHVTNATSHPVDALVVATVEDARGSSARASMWIERLAAHESRAIELFCPQALEPVAVHWSVTPL